MVIETIADRYDVIRRIGAGGMGDVWLAQDRVLGRDVAIKFVSDRQLVETPGAAKILEDEARTAGRLLGNPQVVSVLDLLHVEASLHRGPALIMEYVEGCNVAEWISIYRERMDEPTRHLVALFIALEATEAIVEAHKLGILHRDIKPHNILCSATGRVKVADFGLARVVEALTRTHTVWGHRTPLYAAPEQWRDERPTEDTDVYQLCGTAYHLLAGKPANSGRSFFGLGQWHESGTPEPISGLVAGLDSGVAEVIMAGLAKDPDARSSPWQIFDAISRALMRTLRMTFLLGDCTNESLEKAHRVLDVELGELTSKQDAFTLSYPNPFEALREAVGIVLLGGSCRLVES